MSFAYHDHRRRKTPTHKPLQHGANTSGSSGGEGEVIVEFAGPSCAGKSTLIRHTERDLRRAGIGCRVVRGRALSRRHLLMALGDPRLAVWCLLNSSSIAKTQHRLRIRNLLCAVGSAKRFARDDELILLDEGPLKICQSRYIRGLRLGRSLLVASMPAPSIVVWVSCDPDVRIERLRKFRPNAPLWTRSELVRADAEKRALVEHVARTKGVTIQEVDTTNGDKQSHHVITSLQSLLVTE